MYFDNDILNDYYVNFDLLDILGEKFIFAADAYLGIRMKKYKEENIYCYSHPLTLGLKVSLHGLFYDSHALMNNEIIFLRLPKYIKDKNLELSEEEYLELDELEKLMLEPDKILIVLLIYGKIMINLELWLEEWNSLLNNSK